MRLLPHLLEPQWFLCLLGDLLNGWNDIGIGGAAAEVAAHALTDLIVVEGDVRSLQISAHHTGPASLGLAQHPDRRADLARGTIAALEGVVRDERPLEGVQVLAVGKPLDRDDLGILMRDGKGKAAIDASAIKQHGTGPTLSMVTAFLCAGEPKVLAQRIQERGAGIDGKLVGCSIHLKSDGKIHMVCDSFSSMYETMPTTSLSIASADTFVQYIKDGIFICGRYNKPMELRHLRYFIAVAEELHFSRAAQRLHMAQPPLSQQIQSLEQELGVPLLVRTKRSVHLTEAGRAFLGEARKVIAQAERAVEVVRKIS